MRTGAARVNRNEEDLFAQVYERETAEQSLPEAFKRIYYHLYSNSSASRAEAIIEDLSLLLLCKLAAEANGGKKALASYIAGKGAANSVLVPLLREAYPTALGTRQRFSLGEAPLRSALRELEKVELSAAPAHSLGEAFQALIGPRLRGEKGQFFTPKSLVRAMVKIIDPKPNESIADPACGTGGFLAETHSYQLHAYAGERLSGKLIGVDKDGGLARLANALLKIVMRNRGAIYDFNSLSSSEWQDHVGQSPENAFDVILTNPPFGAKIGIKDPDILRQFDFGHTWAEDRRSGRWIKTGATSGSADPQILFLEFCVRALRPGGRLGIVLPEGIFGNRQTSFVWEWLESQGDVFALLDCPRTTFQPGTDTKTNVLFFRKSADQRGTVKRTRKTQIAVALNCGHDRRGRSVLSNGRELPDDFETIATSYGNGPQASSVWRDVDLAGRRYLVPRYYYETDDTFSNEHDLLAGAKVVTLNELMKDKVIAVRKGHEVGSEAYGTGEIPFVRTSDLANFEISSDPTNSVSESVYGEYAPQQRLKPGDILVVVDGRYRIGTTAMLTKHNYRCVVQSHLRIVSAMDYKALDPFELLFALNLPSVKLRMRSLVFIQSTLGTLGTRLFELRIPILHGDGPWAERIEKFRTTLQRRSELLAELSGMAGPEYEL